MNPTTQLRALRIADALLLLSAYLALSAGLLYGTAQVVAVAFDLIDFG